MSRRIELRGGAKLDLAEAALWYVRQRAELGDEFITAIGSHIKQIAARPQSFPIMYRQNVRRALADRFPYAIYFIESGSLLTVVAILHTSRDHSRILRRRI